MTTAPAPQGFLLYDLGLVAPCRKLWSQARPPYQPDGSPVTAEDLLTLPPGGVTGAGIRHNVLVRITLLLLIRLLLLLLLQQVGLLFIEAWLNGRGVVVVKGAVEDSATAEISRSQVEQKEE